MWEIRAEVESDADAIDALVAASFGPGRFAKSAWRLREGVRPVTGLRFVAVEEGTLLGSVRFWPISVGENPALLLGPLAVEGAERGRGIGIALMNHGIEAARHAGHSVVLLVGDLPYYSRAGFTAIKPGSVRFPGPVSANRVLGLALKEGALEQISGTVRRGRIDEAVRADGAGWGPG